MIRKLTLLFLLCICFQSIVNGQTLDSVTIYLTPFSDTTCPGTELNFRAVQSNDTFSTTSYQWYTNDIYTGVSIDTFYTTALNNGDVVYCKIFYVNSLGVLDSATSNFITIYHSNNIPPQSIISLTTGNNPDCGGHPLTFTVFPLNGGSAPTYQWLVNDTAVAGANGVTFTGTFPGGDSISCLMVSNSTCAPYDTAYSNKIPILNYNLTADITTIVARDTICAGATDTLSAVLTNAGNGYSIAWYVDTSTIPSALGPTYITDSLHNGELVYSILTAPDSCIINHTALSNVITIDVSTDLPTSVNVAITQGTNPGCLDSPVIFTANYVNFGFEPALTWYVNGIAEATDTSSFGSTFVTGDIVTFRIRATDNGCYANDSLLSSGFVLTRDSTPPAPLVSLHDNVLEANTAGLYTWYLDGNIIPGAINQVYHPTALLGYYYATYDSANCPSLPSNTIYVALLSVNTVSNENNIQLYPNPTSGILNMDFGKSADMTLDVYNTLGQVVLHEDIVNQTHYSTDLSNLPQGNYLVNLKDSGADKSSTFKILLGK